MDIAIVSTLIKHEKISVMRFWILIELIILEEEYFLYQEVLLNYNLKIETIVIWSYMLSFFNGSTFSYRFIRLKILLWVDI